MQSLEMNGDQFTALVNLSLLRADEEAWLEALNLSGRAMELDGAHPEARHAYAWALIHTAGREAEGRAEFAQLADVSQNPNMLVRQAILMAADGDHSQAAALAEAALAIRSDFALADVARQLLP